MGCRREGRGEAGARLPGGRDAPPTRVLCRLPRGIGACGRRPELPTSGPVHSQFGGDRSLEGESRKRFPSTWGVAGGGRKEPGEEAGVEPARGAARQPAALRLCPQSLARLGPLHGRKTEGVTSQSQERRCWGFQDHGSAHSPIWHHCRPRAAHC